MSFKDRVTKQRVTVENAEVTTIGDDEYRALRDHLRAQPARDQQARTRQEDE